MDSTEPTSPRSTRHSKRSALIGALIGMSALAGTIVGVGAIASADDTTGDDAPSTTVPVDTTPPFTTDEGLPFDEFAFDEDFAAFDACMADQFDDAELAEPEQFDDANAACESLLPDDVLADIEAWRPYEECIADQLGDIDEPWMDLEIPSDSDFEAYETAWQAADEVCRELLPDDVAAEMAAWDAFDQCLSDAGGFDEEFVGTVVQVDTPDGFQMVEFGEVEGSVTITGTADGVMVTSTGGVTVLDDDALDARWDAFDAAQAECEQLLSEDAFGEFGFDQLDEDHADG
jgi:hypothetical protein